MSALDALLPPALLPAIGEALLHSLWQGALVAATVALGLRFVARDDPEARHGLALGGLAVLVLGFAWSLGRAWTVDADGAGAAALHALARLSPAELAARVRGLAGLEGDAAAAPLTTADARTWAAALWLLGLATMTLRFGRAQRWSRRLLRASVAPEGTDLQARVDELARALGLRRAPRLLLSPQVESPALVGWWRPVLLLPLCALSGLTPDQLRAVLAHELAHLRRLDHTVNAFLALAEWLLFFHPATWWLAGIVRREREHCCDRTAVDLTGQPRRLAEALARLESLRAPDATPTLAARDGDGPLLRRITHILQPTTMKTLHARSRRLRAALLLTGLLVGTGWTRAALANATNPDATAVATAGDPAEDLEVLRQRLQQAVATGHLTGEEARRVMCALEASVAASERESRAALEEQWRRAGAELKAAVERGDVTPAEAGEALDRLRERVSRRSGDARAVERDPRLDDVTRGREVRPREAREYDITARPARPGERLDDVTRGREYDITARRVRPGERLEDVTRGREVPSGEARREAEGREWRDAMRAKLEAEVRRGNLSKEQAQRALEDVTVQWKREQEAEAAPRPARERDGDAARLDLSVEDLEAAVRSGRLSKEEAHMLEDMTVEWKRRLEAESGARSELQRARELDEIQLHLDLVERKLEESVRAGDLSKEEARRQYDEASRQWKEALRDAHRARRGAEAVRTDADPFRVREERRSGRRDGVILEVDPRLTEDGRLELGIETRGVDARDAVRAAPADPVGGESAVGRLRADVETVERDLKAAVKAGHLSAEEAQARSKALRRKLEQVERDLERAVREKAERRARDTRPTTKREAYRDALLRAVEAGEVSREEAEAKLRELGQDDEPVRARDLTSSEADAAPHGGSVGGGNR